MCYLLRMMAKKGKVSERRTNEVTVIRPSDVGEHQHKQANLFPPFPLAVGITNGGGSSLHINSSPCPVTVDFLDFNYRIGYSQQIVSHTEKELRTNVDE